MLSCLFLPTYFILRPYSYAMQATGCEETVTAGTDGGRYLTAVLFNSGGCGGRLLISGNL